VSILNSRNSHRPSLNAIFAFIGISAVAGILVAVSVTPAVAVTGMAAQTAIGAFDGLPSYLQIGTLDQRSTIYAKQGNQQVPIATFYAQNRQDVSYNDIAKVVRDAAIDTEDPTFYTEGGINISGTIRGALSTGLGSNVSGGSSITQQYVKNVLVQQCDAQYINNGSGGPVTAAQQASYQTCYANASGVTIDRKLKEMRYAIGIDKTYTKQQVLTGYFNITGFGGQVYGIQAAAQYYFNTTAKNLNLVQAATLVAILNNPSNLRIDQPANAANGSANGYKLTLARRDYVLKRMLAVGSITAAEEKAAIATPITPQITPVQTGCAAAAAYNAAYFCSYVESTILQNPAFGATAADRMALFNQGGLNIYTTLDLGLQTAAQNAINAYIPAYDPKLDLGSSNVSMEVGTGRVVTMVQNTTYNDTATATQGQTAINYNTDMNYGGSQGFQTGSSFKAFDLAAWLQAGYSLNDVINATTHNYTNADFTNSCYAMGNTPWPVSNDEGTGATMTVLQATEASVNTAFTKMAERLDLCNILNDAKSLGVHLANPNGSWVQTPSLILGTNYIAPLTMATAYAGLANNGITCTPVAIDKMVNASGKSLPVPQTTCTQGIAGPVANGVVWALQHVLTNGTATSANPNDGVPIMGKTGTTDNSLENWLVTSTTKVATATWVGNVQGSVPLRSQTFKNVNGGNVKFAIAKPILKAIDAQYGGTNFTAPPNSMIYGGPGDPLYVAPTPTATPTPTPTSTPNPTSGPGVPGLPVGPGNGGTPAPKPGNGGATG
jgi:membrane peptidoglycan carboxypeptidase